MNTASTEPDAREGGADHGPEVGEAGEPLLETAADDETDLDAEDDDAHSNSESGGDEGEDDNSEDGEDEDSEPMLPPRPLALVFGALSCVISCLFLSLLGGLIILAGRRVREFGVEIEHELDPSLGLSIMLREHMRFLLQFAIPMGTGIVIYAGIELIALVPAFFMRRWALMLQFPLAAGLLVSGVGTLPAILLLSGASLALDRLEAHPQCAPRLLGTRVAT